MNLLNRFRRKDDQEDKLKGMDPNDMAEPSDLTGFMRRGWAYHSHGQHEQAENDFRKALKLDPKSVDANYVLGLVFKAQGRKKEALESFNKVLELLQAGKVNDAARSEMLRRLSLGHINELEKGDWDLQTEVWRQK